MISFHIGRSVLFDLNDAASTNRHKKEFPSSSRWAATADLVLMEVLGGEGGYRGGNTCRYSAEGRLAMCQRRGVVSPTIVIAMHAADTR